MAATFAKKRKMDGPGSGKTIRRKITKSEYHSSSSSEADSDNHSIDNAGSASSDRARKSSTTRAKDAPDDEVQSDDEEDEDADDESDEGSSATSAIESNIGKKEMIRQKPKRNDPEAFAASISTILGSKLTASKREDPVLARSVSAAEANASINNARLETKVRQKAHEDKRRLQEKGRVKDVILGMAVNTKAALGSGESSKHDDPFDSEVETVGQMQEQERRLRKTAQRGVVKLFNAVRQAQIKGEEARKQAGSRDQRAERVQEMSKTGFLEMVASGGSTAQKQAAQNIVEA